jgi:uncharacterized secreted protein with C-terminal beta-propeller domain
MKKLIGFLALGLLLFSSQVLLQGGLIDPPTILSINLNETNLVIKIQVPVGIKRITLEGKENLNSKSWVPKAARTLTGAAEILEIQIARNADTELLRVRAEDSVSIPGNFFQGTTTFSQISTQPDPNASPAPGLDDRAISNNNSSPESGTPSRGVVESDIWKVAGNRLYYFNQYRGLQVLDITQPDDASLLGTFELSNAGDQMYLLRETNVVLITQGNCYQDYGQQAGGSQLWTIDVKSGQPSPLATVPIEGYFRESRLVGDVLYLATWVYEPIKTNNYVYEWANVKYTNQWIEWGAATIISSIDLSNSSQPQKRSELRLDGFTTAISATDTYFFVSAGSQWGGSSSPTTLHCFDITAPSGEISHTAQIPVSGIIKDKFKIQWVDGILSLIVESSVNTNLHTFLINYRLPDPRSAGPISFAKLGAVELGRDETLFGTRFDGTKVYIVTFRRIDPLWIVDNSNPSAPAISGELEVPGWSTYLHPMGDRLLTMGIDSANGWRVSVSLFDVSLPAKPSLLSKVFLGENYSWSEANADEKALAVIPEAGLIMVPFQSWSTQSVQGLQLIDLDRNALAKRGVIEDQSLIRRAALVNDRIVAVSGTTYLSVDATDRDHPLTRQSLLISWQVDQVFLAGEYLLQLQKGISWGSDPSTRVFVSSANDPSTILSTFVLSNTLPVWDATFRNQKLYVASGIAPSISYEWGQANDSTNFTHLQKPIPGTLILTVLNASNLPQLSQQSETSSTITNRFYSLKHVWATDEVLTLYTAEDQGWYPMYSPFLEDRVNSVEANFIGRPWFYEPLPPAFFTFDLSGSQPKFGAEFRLMSTNEIRHSTAQLLARNGVLYFDHTHYAVTNYVTNTYVYTNYYPWFTASDASQNAVYSNTYVTPLYEQKFYLDRLDVSEPSSPILYKPVNIPGNFNGLGFGTSVIYTRRSTYFSDTNENWLEASAFDGTTAFFIDGAALSPVVMTPNAVSFGDSLFLFQGGSTNQTFESWTVDLLNGKLKKQSQWNAGSIAYQLSRVNDLIVFNNGKIQVFDGNQPENLQPLLDYDEDSCIHPNLPGADGSRSRGLWLPRHQYSVRYYPLLQP